MANPDRLKAARICSLTQYLFSETTISEMTLYSESFCSNPLMLKQKLKRKINHQLRANDREKITAHIQISDIFVVAMMNSLTDKLRSYVRHP